MNFILLNHYELELNNQKKYKNKIEQKKRQVIKLAMFIKICNILDDSFELVNVISFTFSTP